MVGSSDVVALLLQGFSEDCITFGGPPQSIEDCWQRYSNNVLAFEKCLELLDTQP